MLDYLFKKIILYDFESKVNYIYLICYCIKIQTFESK